MEVGLLRPEGSGFGEVQGLMDTPNSLPTRSGFGVGPTEQAPGTGGTLAVMEVGGA